MQMYPKMVMTSALGGYVMFDNILKPADIFSMMQILNAFRSAFMQMIQIFPVLVQVGPSITRIDKFMKLRETGIPNAKSECKESWLKVWPPIEEAEIIQTQRSARTMDAILNMQTTALRVQGNFVWHMQMNKKPHKYALKNVDITV